MSTRRKVYGPKRAVRTLTRYEVDASGAARPTIRGTWTRFDEVRALVVELERGQVSNDPVYAAALRLLVALRVARFTLRRVARGSVSPLAVNAAIAQADAIIRLAEGKQ